MNTQWTSRDVITFAVLLGILFLAGIAAWKGDRVDSKLGAIPSKVEIVMPEQPPLVSDFTCPDGTTHHVTTVWDGKETFEQMLERHRLRVEQARQRLCGLAAKK